MVGQAESRDAIQPLWPLVVIGLVRERRARGNSCCCSLNFESQIKLALPNRASSIENRRGTRSEPGRRSTMDTTSLSLLDQARDTSNAEAWRQLVSLYEPLLKKWLRQHQLQTADADDVVQEVLTAVLKDLPRFEHNQRPGAFRNWLRTTLVFRLQNHWRSRDRSPKPAEAAHLAELSDEATALSQVWNQQHDQHVMTRLLERVRPRFEPQTWEAFRRQMFDGQSPKDVAAELDLSLNSVYVARSRVLRALRSESAGLLDSFD